MTKEEIINIAWNIFPISDREKNEAFIELLIHFAQGIAQKEREKCAERAWIALVKHCQPWNVRQDVTDAIKARRQE